MINNNRFLIAVLGTRLGAAELNATEAPTHGFIYRSTAVTFAAAEVACALMDGHLPSIHDLPR